MNIGKKFEEDFKNSVPDYALFYRLPDAAQSFGGGNSLRFSRKNPFDCLIWNPKRRLLYALELKTVKGKSISFERTYGESREIHYHQIQGLNDWNQYDGVICGFIIWFRELEKTIFINIDSFNFLIEEINKKSFNYDDLVNSEVQFYVIPQKKKRTRYRYDINALLSQ